MTTLQYEPHPANLAFPYITGVSWKRFLADLDANGQRERIVLGRGSKPRTKVILDGKIRLKGCLELGLEPQFEDWEGDDQFSYVISANLWRRQLNESQRALVALRLRTLKPHRPTKGCRSAGLSTSEAADLLNVGERTVRRAGSVIARGVPELVQAVEQGDITVDAAAELARLGKGKQRSELAAAAAGLSNLRDVAREENRLTAALRLTDSDLAALRALAALGDDSSDPRARAGVVVMRRIVPALGARA